MLQPGLGCDPFSLRLSFFSISQSGFREHNLEALRLLLSGRAGARARTRRILQIVSPWYLVQVRL